jgi:hypothetical protein
MSPEVRLELIALLARDEAWKAIVHIGRALLEEYYPEHIFDGSSGDSGPNYIVALREALAGFADKPDGVLLSRSIAELELSARAHNAITTYNTGHKTLGDLVKLTPGELLRLPNFGKLSLDEVEEALQKFGLSLQRSRYHR